MHLSLANRTPFPTTLPFGAVTAAAVLGARSTEGGRSPWYRLLKKPSFQPPSAAFGPVWTTLYGMMAVSAGRVARRPASPERSAALTLWAAQLGVNAAYSWLFFSKKRPAWALADIGALLGLVSGYTAMASRVDRPAAWLMAPYLAWTTFAGILNGTLLAKNRRRLPLLRRLFA